MKKLYFLALLCFLGFGVLAQTTTIYIYATGAPTQDTTATCTLTAAGGTTFSRPDINAGNVDTNRGYAVFDLSAIPMGAVVTNVVLGFTVSGYASNTAGANLIYGVPSDLSTLAGTPAALYTAMAPALPSELLYTASWGGGTGNVVTASTALGVLFIGGNIPTLATPDPKVSMTWTNSGADNYTIEGENGVVDTTGVHVPYLRVTFCAQPTAVTATASPVAVCEGYPLSLSETDMGANTYIWTGPDGFTSTLADPVDTASLASAGVYTLTAVNVCGIYSASTTATTAAVTVTGGPITGITNLWVGFTTTLSDPYPGGTWGISGPSGIASVDPASGVVTGIMGLDSTVVSYTSPLGCVYYASVLVNPSIFTQLPVVAGGGGGLGFPLIAWYPFCGDTVDHATTSVGGSAAHNLNNSSVTIVPGLTSTPAVLTTDRFGLPGNAYQYNGVSSMMQYSTFFPISGPTGDYTYTFWFEIDTPQNSVILYNGTLGSSSPLPPYNWSNGWGFVINDGTAWAGPPAVYTTNPGDSLSVVFGGVAQVLSTPVSLHRWHNVVLKKNGGSYDLYLDDVSIGFSINTYMPMSAITGSIFRLGMDSTGTKPFNGKLDDIAIYNRQLSDGERDSLYNFNPDARAFTLGNDTTICSDSITLFPMPPTIGNVYLWTPTGLTTDTLSVDSAITVNPGLESSYTLQVGKPYGCNTYDTIIVYTQPIPVDLGPNVQMCLGDTITLTSFYPDASFLWSTGDTAHSIKVYSTGTYSVLVDSVLRFSRTSPTGVVYMDSTVCIGRDTISVNVAPVPVLGIPPTVANCDGSPYTLHTYYDTSYTYAWDGSSFLNTDSLHVIASGQYWVKVSNGGCSRSDTANVIIVFDTVSLFSVDTAICQGMSVTPRPTINPIVTYQWTPTDGISVSNIAIPTITPDTSAYYVMIVSYPGCPDIRDSFYIDVQPKPDVNIGGNRKVCQNDTLHILTGVTPSWYTHYIYSWSPATYLDHNNTPVVVFRAGDTTELVVRVEAPEMLTTSDTTCFSVDSATIFTYPGYFDSMQTQYTLCPGDSILLMPTLNAFGAATGQVVSSYHWSPGTYLDDSTSATPVARPITSIDYSLIATSQYGCNDTLGVSMKVNPAAEIYLGDSVIIAPGDTVHISPQTNCSSFTWYPPLGLNAVNISNPVATPDVSTTYVVAATTENGCTVLDSIRIHVDPGTFIILPNAFTPGASVNSTFNVIKRGLVGINYFRIFDRWGNKVFETNNIDAGWDGNFNGKPQPLGVYVYEVEAVTSGGKVFHAQGNVTLIR